MKGEFRQLPSVDRMMSEARIKELQGIYPHDLLVDLIRQQLEHERASISRGNPCPPVNQIADSIYARAHKLISPGPGCVINATGVILHTNLGRAPLSEEALAAMEQASKDYCDLEFDLDTGVRGHRNIHVESILCQLTGAEAALVVNNNASGVLLALTALAKRKEVIVSRGQAVAIGGGFRIPEVMRQSGAKLMEVGTTNVTSMEDFEGAISPRTAALMRVHSSNFRIVGFTQSISLEELVELGKRHDLLVLDDLGSGCLLDTTAFGLDPEPTIQQSISLGASLSFSSGDKLLGGPQAGIIAGKKELVEKLKKHPLARAARIDKTRLAGLRATLIHYLKGEALERIPVWRMISAPLDEMERRAKKWAAALGEIALVTEGESMVGGGSLPGGTLPTRLVSIGKQVRKGERNTAQILAERLRAQSPPIVGRLSGNILLLDPRSVPPQADRAVIEALRSAAVG